MESRGITLFYFWPRRGWGVSVMPRPHLTPGKDPVPIVQEAGWASGPVWTGAENLASTGIRSPDRPARRQSLYRLRYPRCNVSVWNDRCPRFKEIHVDNNTCIQKNCRHRFLHRYLCSAFPLQRKISVLVLRRMTLAFGSIMLHPRFFYCHHSVKKSLIFIFLAKKVAGKCQIFELSPLPWECEEPICTNLRVFKNISNVTHTFLSNANFASKIWVIRRFSLISSSIFPLWNSSVAVTGRQTHCLLP